MTDILLSIILNTFKITLRIELFSEKLFLEQIIPLYKNKDLTIIKNYRLITLLNSDYKIIIKAPLKRFSKVLKKVADLY